ncbi:MAG: ABC transporter permease [Pyrinomonadaceae bacterium]|nr:ABC transporter permease [Phycisphaerales bacterium]
MYQALLTRKYLTSKILPLLAACAVMLCTLTVLVVWSIMGGFLTSLIESGRAHVGDVSIEWPNAGYAYYDELVSDLENRDEIKAAAATIESFAVVQYPDKRYRMLLLIGVEPKSYNRITGFQDSLWWRPLNEAGKKDRAGRDIRVVSLAPLLEVWIPEACNASIQRIDEMISLSSGWNNSIPDSLKDARQRLVTLAQDSTKLARQSRPDDPPAEALLAFRTQAGEVFNTVSTIVYSLDDAKTHAGNAFTLAQVWSQKRDDRPQLGNTMSDLGRALERLGSADVRRARLNDKLANGLSLTVEDPRSGARIPGILLGTEHSTYNQRERDGYYTPIEQVSIRQSDGSYADVRVPIAGYNVTLNLMPSGSGTSKLDSVMRSLPVANEFKTGIYEIDSGFGMVQLDTLQSLLNMQETEEIAPISDPYAVVVRPDGTTAFPEPTVTGRSPARVTNVIVRGADGVDLAKVKAACQSVYAEFARRHAGKVPREEQIKFVTWRDKKATLVAAVEKEIIMMLLIMGVISATVSFLILAIFWAIVREKTKDIGILRAMGASRRGVSAVWLGYALIIGLIGSLAGGVLAHVVVWNINEIHDWMGKTLGISVWSPEVYYISKIPNQIDSGRALLVVCAGMFFSVLGAMIPAVLAARMDPVKSLRFE